MKRLEAIRKSDELKEKYPMLGTLPKHKGILGSVIFTVFFVLFAISFAELAFFGLMLRSGTGSAQLFLGDSLSSSLGDINPQIMIIAGAAGAALCVLFIIIKFISRARKNKKLFNKWVDDYNASVPDEAEKQYELLSKYCGDYDKNSCSKCIHCKNAAAWHYDGEKGDSIFDCELHGKIEEIAVGRYYYLHCPDCEWYE